MGGKMMDDLKRVKRNKIILILVVSGVVVLIVLAIIFAIINRDSDYTEPEDSSVGELIGDSKEKFLVFYNNIVLTDMYGLEVSSRITENFEEFVLSDEEMEFSRNNSPIEDNAEVYYDATIDVDNMFFYDPYTIGFKVGTSDERGYQVLVQTNPLDRDNSYVYVAITRDGSDEIMLFVNGDNVDENEFVDFAKEKLGKNLVKIVRKNLDSKIAE